jgi:signal transduction histidine kinase
MTAYVDSTLLGQCVLAVSEEGLISTQSPMAEALFGPLERAEPSEIMSRCSFYWDDEQTPLTLTELPLGALGRGGTLSREIFVRTPSRPNGLHLRMTATPALDGTRSAVVVCEPVDAPFDSRWWRTVARVADVVARSHDYETVLSSFRSALQVEVAFSGVALLAAQTGDLEVVAAAGDATPPVATRLELDEDAALQLRRAVVRQRAVDGEGTPLSALCARFEIGALLTVPLYSGGQFVGVIAVTRRQPSRFSPREAALFDMVAPHLAHAVSNVRAALLRKRWSRLLVHDLKSPLAALTLNLDLVIEQNVSGDELAATVRDCRRSVKQLVGMTKDLYDMLLFEEVGVTLHRTVVDLAQIVEEVFAPMRDTTAQGVLLHCGVPRGFLVTIDVALFQRVIDNIVSNALRYTPSGGSVRVDVAVDREAVIISIENDGRPIDAETAASLFSRYGDHGSREARSRGVGLYLCRLFVEAHDGTITLVPTVPGTRFEIRLPRAAHVAYGLGADAVVKIGAAG